MMPSLSIGEPTLMGRRGIVKDGLTTDYSRTGHHLTATPALHDAVVGKQIGEAGRVLGVPPVGILCELFRDEQPVFYGPQVLAGGFGPRQRAQHTECHGPCDGRAEKTHHSSGSMT